MPFFWESLCRLCANSKSCDINLFDENNESTAMVQLIFKHMSFLVKIDDTLPAKICRDCGEKMTAFHSFTYQCERAQILFQKHIHDTRLGDDRHLQYPNSERSLNCSPISIKKEHDQESIVNNSVHDDLNSICDIKGHERNINKKPSSKRKCVKKTINQFKNKITDNNILNGFDRLLDNENLSNSNIKYIDKKSQDIKEESFSDEDIIDDLHIHNPKQERKIKTYNEADFSIFRFTCHICEVECFNWNTLKSHAKVAHKTSAKVLCICLKFLSTKISLLNHIIKHDPSKCKKCISCDKIFATQKELESHANIHLPKDELPHVCCKCAKRFTTARILKVHEKTHIPREERVLWLCELCNNNFATKGALGHHKRVIHEKLRPYICDLCGSVFSTKANLEEHCIRHGSDKKFDCSQCQKRFKTKAALLRHKDTHGDTAYQCPHCPMLLNTRRTLRNHLFVHDEQANHVCLFCGKSFKRRKDLKVHLKVHTGERPYSCPWCKKTFNNGSNFRIHKKRIHPNEFQIAEADNAQLPAISNQNDFAKKVIHTTIKVHPMPLRAESTGKLFQDKHNNPEKMQSTNTVDASQNIKSMSEEINMKHLSENDIPNIMNTCQQRNIL